MYIDGDGAPLALTDVTPMDIAYAAHTKTCTFLLDSEGICRDVVGADGVSRHAGPTAERCIGAQYVASLDAESRGILVDMPRIGLPIVFARVDARGRVSLVRTGVLLRLEPRRTTLPPPAPPARGSEPPQQSAEYPIRQVPAAAVTPAIPPRERLLAASIPPAFAVAGDDETLLEDTRTQRFDLEAPSEAPATLRHAESRAYVPTERAHRVSDIVPKHVHGFSAKAATYEERSSIFPPISPMVREPGLDEQEPLSPYAIPLRRVK